MNTFPFMLGANGSLTVYVDNEPLVFASDNPRLQPAMEALRNNDGEKLKDLAKPAVAVAKYVQSVPDKDGKYSVTFEHGQVLMNGVALHNACTERIIQCETLGLDFTPMMRFLENLQENPSYRAVHELWNFLDHKGLPITPDGHFLAYKRVRDDFYDFHTGTVNYAVGTTVTKPRNEVNEDSRVECSNGLHAGTLNYVDGFNAGRGKVLIVKINPKDVVSVPEADAQKLRCCKMEVIGEYNRKLPSDTYAQDRDYVDNPALEWNDDDDDENDEDDSWVDENDNNTWDDDDDDNVE